MKTQVISVLTVVVIFVTGWTWLFANLPIKEELTNCQGIAFLCLVMVAAIGWGISLKVTVGWLLKEKHRLRSSQKQWGAMKELRVLTDEELGETLNIPCETCDIKLMEEPVKCMKCIAYLHREVQHQFLMKGFVELLEDIFSTAKTDKEVWTKAQELLGNLKQLVE